MSIITEEMPTRGSDSMASEIQKKGIELVRLHRQKKEEYGLIEPEYLLGFRDGDCADLAPYETIGFPHPKSQSYYKATFDEQGEPVAEQTDPDFLKIYQSIVQSGKIDDPLLIYFYGGQILVLNGLTRLSAVGQRRQFQPGFMKRVPYRLYVGDETQARGEMVRLNLDGRQRVIKQREFVSMVQHFKRMNMSVGEIRKMITGSAEGNYEVNNTITVAYYGCADLIKKLLDKKMPLGTAAEIALVEDPVKQLEITKQHDKGISLQKTKLLTRGIGAVSPMIDDIFRKIAKVREATEALGIYPQCEHDFVGLETSLDSLKKSIVEVEREAEDQAAQQPAVLGITNGTSASSLSMATDPQDEAPPVRQKRKYRKRNSGEPPSDEIYHFQIAHNGDGKIDPAKVKMDEVERFVSLWWRECASRPTDAGELYRLADKHKSFKYMDELGDSPRGRAIWFAKCILVPLAGTKNAIGDYYWLRGSKDGKGWWKLERLEKD